PRPAPVIGGYGQVLRLTPGSRRAAGDLLCRTFDHAPPDQQPDLCPPSLTGFSAAVEAALEQAPSGGDWPLHLTEHAGERGFGLTAAQMQPLVVRLASEMGRSMG